MTQVSLKIRWNLSRFFVGRKIIIVDCAYAC